MTVDADALLFGDAIGCEERLPLAFVAGDGAPGNGRDQVMMVIRALALFEDGREPERDDDDPRAVELARLEAKVDLALSLLGILARERSAQLPVVTVRWSRLGARFATDAAPTAATGRLLIQLDPRLPQCIELSARVVATRPQGDAHTLVWARFEGVDESLEAAIERHVFRRHRRQVAEARRGGGV